MSNRLAKESSPYLLQHKDNPVEWYPWGEEAFQTAQKEGKPVFLSVGYSSCHWCHVMEHESFENHEIAGILNKYYISIKVDREERPDVDEAYMTAVQYSSGRGGWPMSVFLTPDKKPFFAGTYFPKEDREGIPGFRTILSQIASTWATRRAELEKVGEEFGLALNDILGRPFPASERPIDRSLFDQAVQVLASEFDPENGGTQGAPKFPPHSGLEFLMRYALEAEVPNELREAALAMALLTLEKICLGGIHDHIGGGFHRYSTDEHWVLPHFEKMLYDNALLMRNLQLAMGITRQLDERLSVLFTLALGSIIGWIGEEMISKEGFFYSAVDADSEGVEGKFYTWTSQQVRELLGPKADAFLKAYNFEPGGNFLDEATQAKTGENVPFLTEEWDLDYVEDLKVLAEARAKRVKPGLDDKAIVAWSGLVIGSMPTYLSAKAAAGILAAEQKLGFLPHQITRGFPSGRGFLDDYAYFAFGLLTCADLIEYAGPELFVDEQSGEKPVADDAWRRQGERLVAKMVELFYDEENGGFFFTSKFHEELFGRTKSAFDQPMPSANSIAIRCLLAVGDFDRARKSLDCLSGWMEKAPTATEGLLIAAMDYLGAQAAIAEETSEAPTEIPIASEAAAEAAPAAKPVKKEVHVKLESRELHAEPDGSAVGKVIIEVPEGLHINSSEPPARWLTPTRVSIKPIIGEATYGPSENDRYEGRVEIPFKVHLPEREDGADFEVLISYQACTDSECLLPQEKAISAVVVRS